MKEGYFLLKVAYFLNNKKMNYMMIVFMPILLLVGMSCSKDDEVKDLIQMCYDETYGADPWKRNENDEKTKENVKNYLSDSINVYTILIDEFSDFDPCKAMDCKTGRRFKVEIEKNDIEKIKKRNFYECK